MTTIDFTSDAVRSAKFVEKRRGYHVEEVDAFLQRTAAAFDQLSNRLAEANSRALQAEAALSANSEAEEAIRRTLALAQRTAAMAVREADEEAERIRIEAQDDAEQLTAEAGAEAARLVAEARDRAGAMDQEAARTRAAAYAHATATVDEADATAQTTVREADRRAAEAETAVVAHITARRAEADAEIERRSIEATRDIEAAVDSLRRQRDQIAQDVAALAGYLAEERARVLDVLSSAVERFGASLTPFPTPMVSLPALPVTPAAGAGDEGPADEGPADEGPADEGPAEGCRAIPWFTSDGAGGPRESGAGDPSDADAWLRDTAWDLPSSLRTEDPAVDPAWPAPWRQGREPADHAVDPVDQGHSIRAQAHDWGVAAMDDEPPSRLLFTVDDEGRRQGSERDTPAEPRTRKTLRSRRRG